MKGFLGMQQLVKQAQQMQNRLKRMKEEMADKEFIGQAGGGAVKVKIKGSYECQSVEIQKELMDSKDLEMLQDLVMTATNQVLQEIRETLEKETQRVSGGLPSIPGLF